MSKATIINGKKSTDVLVQLNVPVTKENINIVTDLIYAEDNDVSSPDIPMPGHITIRINDGDMVVKIYYDMMRLDSMPNLEIYAKENMIHLVKEALAALTGASVEDINMDNYVISPQTHSIDNATFLNPGISHSPFVFTPGVR